MDDVVDLHNHLLPGVDDGAESFDESLFHLRELYCEGVRRLAVSPHLFGWLANERNGLELRLDRLAEVFGQLEQFVSARTDVPQLFFSQEILCPTPEIASAVFRSPRAGLRGTRYALVEFGFDLKIDCRDVVHAVLDSGRRMIVSHPERYRRNGEPVTLQEIRSWKDAGALLQVNSGSVVGDYGEAVKRTAWQLLRDGLADLIASDHHADNRVVSPAEAARAIIEQGGLEQARRLMSENPGRILADDDVLSVPGLPDRSAA